MDANTLNGLAVVSLQEGARLGHVEQPIFDLAARQLIALEVDGNDGTFTVDFDQIESIGSDAVTVASSQVTQTPNVGGAVGVHMGLKELKKLKIVDNEGTFLGTLDTVEFDTATGLVTQLSAHKGGVLGVGGTSTPVEASSIVMVGADLLTVTMEESGNTTSAT